MCVYVCVSICKRAAKQINVGALASESIPLFFLDLHEDFRQGQKKQIQEGEKQFEKSKKAATPQ